MGAVIEVQIDQLLKKQGRSFYWLSKETGISYTTLWRLKKGKALGLNFATLIKLCSALECEPGDFIKLASTGKRTAAKTKVASRPTHGRPTRARARGN